MTDKKSFKIHALIPQFILDQFEPGETKETLHGGSFPGSALFVDISGFSSITEALMQHGQFGAEVLATVMRAVFNPLVECVYGQGGFIATLAGDAFTALFPGPDDSTAWRCLAAACEIQARMAENTLQHTPYGDFQFAIKAGLAWGETRWGIVSSADRSRATYYFEGEAIDSCSAAEQLALPGQILFNSAFQARIQARVESVPVENHHSLTRILEPLPDAGSIEMPEFDLDQMARFFPRSLLIQDFSGEFRHVVNMFIRLPTVRTEAQLATFMGSLFALQNQYGGLLNRLDFGDKGTHLLLFWGAPISYENDIERALDFILALQTQTSIPINAGITYRIAHAGFIGSPLREEYTCYGRGVNLAARFMSAAPRGEIWVDAEIARRIEGRFDLDFTGEVSFKGFAERQPVYVLFERKEAIERVYRGKLIGRQAELEQMVRFIKPLKERQPAGILVIWGEAGIGKSRLVHAFSQSEPVESGNMQWALCQADPILRASLNPFRYWLRNYFKQSQAQSEARNKRSFNQQMDGLISETQDSDLAQELDRTRSFLGALIDLYWPDSLYEQLDPQARSENTLAGLETLIVAESLRQSLVLQVEDIHWLDTDSLQFLHHFTQRLSISGAYYPIAVILTARLEPVIAQPGKGQGLLGEGVVYQEITLEQFSRGDLSVLAEDVLGAPAAPSLLGLIEGHTGGNPFFAEQILLYFQDQRLLVRRDTGLVASARLSESEIPTDVRALLVARLDSLDPGVKLVVQIAAILGQEFEFALLSQVVGDVPDVPMRVNQAEKALIWTRVGDQHYAFRHALLRDAAYIMQLRARRQSLHRSVAEAIEKLYQDDLEVHYAELAHHYDQAGLVDLACLYLGKAAERAQEQGAPAEARRHLERALELLPASQGEMRWQILLRRSETLITLGDIETRLENDRVLVALARELNDDRWLAQAYFRQAYGLSLTGQYQEAIVLNDYVIETARAAGDGLTEAQALGLKVFYQSNLGDLQAAGSTAQQALARAEEVTDDETLARVLHSVATFYLEVGDFSSALELHNRQMAILRRQRNFTGETAGLSNIGYIYILLGQAEKGRAILEQSLQLAEMTGNQRAVAFSQLNLALASMRQSDHQAARRVLEESLPIFTDMGDIRMQAFGHCYLGLTFELLGEFDFAGQNFAEARALFEQIGARGYANDALAGLARTLLAQSRLEVALQHAQEVWDYLQSGTGGMEFPLLAFLTCTQVFGAAGESEKSKLALDAGYQALIGRASQISDPEWRKSYLENVPEHHAILDQWRIVFENHRREG